MAYPGKEIIHPVSKERAVFRQTASTTDGRLLEYDVFISPGGFVTVEHVHRYQEEHFEVIEGAGKLRLDGVVRDIKAGDELIVPAGARHIWWNESDRMLHVIVQFRPALRIEYLFETVTGLAQDGKVDPRTGLPSFLQLMVLSHRYFREMNPVWSWAPLWVQRVLVIVLAPVGRLLGYRSVYPQYLD